MRFKCSFLLLTILAIGCHKAVTEKDLIGTWNVDPAAIAGKENSDLLAKEKYMLTADHQYVMLATDALSIKGTWGYLDSKLTVTPQTMVTQSPFEAGKSLEVPIAPAIEQLRKMPIDPNMPEQNQMAEALKTLGTPTTFEVSDDGKKLTNQGKPALLKAN